MIGFKINIPTKYRTTYLNTTDSNDLGWDIFVTESFERLYRSVLESTDGCHMQRTSTILKS